MGDAGSGFGIPGGEPLIVQRLHDPAGEGGLCIAQVGIRDVEVAKQIVAGSYRFFEDSSCFNCFTLWRIVSISCRGVVLPDLDFF